MFNNFWGDLMSHTQYVSARQRLQRSELAVPGTNPGMFEKEGILAGVFIMIAPLILISVAEYLLPMFRYSEEQTRKLRDLPPLPE